MREVEPAADRAIDSLVYELYGLSEEEIGIVEGQMTPIPSFPHSEVHEWGKGNRVVKMKTVIRIQDDVSTSLAKHPERAFPLFEMGEAGGGYDS